MSAAVVAGMDAPPVFKPSERVFDPVALLVEDGVIGDRDLSIGFRGDAGGDPAPCERGAQPIGVVALVGEKLPGLVGQGGQHQRRALVIAHLPLA